MISSCQLSLQKLFNDCENESFLIILEIPITYFRGFNKMINY